LPAVLDFLLIGALDLAFTEGLGHAETHFAVIRIGWAVFFVAAVQHLPTVFFLRHLSTSLMFVSVAEIGK
jgi:hypothetical protein